MLLQLFILEFFLLKPDLLPEDIQYFQLTLQLVYVDVSFETGLKKSIFKWCMIVLVSYDWSRNFPTSKTGPGFPYTFFSSVSCAGIRL